MDHRRSHLRLVVLLLLHEQLSARCQPLDCFEPGVLHRAESELTPLGATLELAVRIPVKANAPTSDRVYQQHFIAVEVDPSGNTEEALERVKRLLSTGNEAGAPPIGDAEGRHIEGISALSVILQVGEHVPKKPRKEKPRSPDDERLKSPRKVGQWLPLDPSKL